MIIVKIIGGLGNQMFQYAAARALAIRKGVPLKLDISAFATYYLHQGFELSRVFNCSADIARTEDVRRMLGWQTNPRVSNLLSKFNLAAFRSRELVIEPSFSYWPGIDEAPDDCYLTGYWQSEKYFSSSATQIRQGFTFRESMNDLNSMIAEKILSVNSVSLHVRRGDYLTDKNANETHGLCSINYYKNSIEYISRNTRNPKYFIFSDDIEWAKSNLKIDGQSDYICFNKNEESYNDMRLMSLCNHHIIANSSFSWWGAWLNPNPTKLVVSPQPWFANPHIDTRDLIPVDWISEIN